MRANQESGEFLRHIRINESSSQTAVNFVEPTKYLGTRVKEYTIIHITCKKNQEIYRLRNIIIQNRQTMFYIVYRLPYQTPLQNIQLLVIRVLYFLLCPPAGHFLVIVMWRTNKCWEGWGQPNLVFLWSYIPSWKKMSWNFSACLKTHILRNLKKWPFRDTRLFYSQKAL